MLLQFIMPNSNLSSNFILLIRFSVQKEKADVWKISLTENNSNLGLGAYTSAAPNFCSLVSLHNHTELNPRPKMSSYLYFSS